MPFIFRSIRKAKWDRHAGVPWLDEGELQADALTDLKTSNNVLSVYVLEDETFIERTATALAANRERLANLDYSLLDIVYLADLNIHPHENRGNTPDEEVNGWHRDFIELSAQKIISLAGLIQEYGLIRRIPEKRITNLIAQGIKAQHIDREKVKQDILTKVDIQLENEP